MPNARHVNLGPSGKCSRWPGEFVSGVPGDMLCSRARTQTGLARTRNLWDEPSLRTLPFLRAANWVQTDPYFRPRDDGGSDTSCCPTVLVNSLSPGFQNWSPTPSSNPGTQKGRSELAAAGSILHGAGADDAVQYAGGYRRCSYVHGGGGKGGAGIVPAAGSVGAGQAGAGGVAGGVAEDSRNLTSFAAVVAGAVVVGGVL